MPLIGLRLFAGTILEIVRLAGTHSSEFLNYILFIFTGTIFSKSWANHYIILLNLVPANKCLPYTVQVISAPELSSTCMHMMTITLHVQNLTLLTEMITPQTLYY